MLFIAAIYYDESRESISYNRSNKEKKINILTNAISFPTFLKKISHTYYGIANITDLN